MDHHPVSALNLHLQHISDARQPVPPAHLVSIEYLAPPRIASEPNLDQQDDTREPNAYRWFLSRARYHWDAHAVDYASLCHVD